MKVSVRNTIISVFVVAWLVVFYYESVCYYYLQPMTKHELPRMKFLFPPSGWIMFYNIGDNFGYTQVYGVKDGEPQMIDPHDILQTRAIGYDNVNRNALLGVLSPGVSDTFCPFLKKKFPYFDKFIVSYVEYPHLTENPSEKREIVAYNCGE